jgi:transposase
MSKYSTSFKLAVVEDYLTGSAGYKTVGHHHGIDHAIVHKWVAFYRLHGKAGLQKKFTHYSAAFKLSVLQHMWAHMLSHIQTAAVFDIRSLAMVGQWERLYHSGGIDALTPRPRGRPKTMPTPRTPPPSSAPVEDTRTREDLLAELNYLRMENAYLKKLDALIQAQKKAAPRKPRK